MDSGETTSPGYTTDDIIEQARAEGVYSDLEAATLRACWASIKVHVLS